MPRNRGTRNAREGAGKSLARQSVNKLISVNFYLLGDCNAQCVFCFAHLTRERLPLAKARSLIKVLRDEGTEKITFAGGEPTLHPNLGELVQYSQELGLVTSLVTNGYRLEELLQAKVVPDWVGFSVDSAEEDTLRRLGRSRGEYLARTVRLVDMCHSLGVRVKVNTVVTSETQQEDMTALILRLAPERWKIFQMLPIQGRNDPVVDRLEVSDSDFWGFVRRHLEADLPGLSVVPEDNDTMSNSYVLVDPLGRFYSNTRWPHEYSAPILEVGAQTALRQVDFDHDKFERRGGLYEWGVGRGQSTNTCVSREPAVRQVPVYKWPRRRRVGRR